MTFSLRGLTLTCCALLATGAAATPPLEAFGRLPGFELAALAPSGARYAVVGVVGEQRNLVVLTPDGAPVLLMPLGDRKVSDIEFVDDDHMILRLRNTQRLGPQFVEAQAELSAAIVVDVPHKTLLPVLQRDQIFGGVAGYYGAAKVGDRLYGFFSAITTGKTGSGDTIWNGNRPDLYRVDLISGAVKIVAKHADGVANRSWLIDRDGEVAATLETNADAGRWTLRGPGGELARGADPVTIELAGLGPTPGSVVYYRSDDDGMQCCFTTGTAERLFDGGAAAAVLTEPLTRRLIGYATDGDQREVHFVDPHREARMRGVRKAFPGLDVELVDASADYDRLIVKTTGTGDSGTWWLVDIKSGKAIIIGRSYPMITEADVAPVRMVQWQAADGLALAGVLTLPPGRTPKNLPLIVMPHGGPAARDYPTFDWWAQALAVQGYAVFQPNFRGSTGYGHALLKAGNGEWGVKMIGDIADGVGALGRQGIVDPKRACIVGASYGGYAALAGVTLQHGLYRCAVAVAPISDLTSFLSAASRGSEDYRVIARSWKQKLGAAPLATLSPAARASEADAPILLIHGSGDTVVPIVQSEMMRARLAKAGKPVEFVTLSGEDHWLSQGSTRLAMLNATLAFVHKHNPPD